MKILHNMFNAARLKKLRKDNGLTQLQMAQKLHIEQSTYSKLETNNYDLNMSILQLLNDDFKVDPKEFLNSYTLHEQPLLNNVSFQSTEIAAGAKSIADMYSILHQAIEINKNNQAIILKNQAIILKLIKKLQSK